MFAVLRCLLFAVCCVLFNVSCGLSYWWLSFPVCCFVMYCALPRVDCCLLCLLVVCGLMFVLVRCLLFVVCQLVFGARRCLFVVCCLLVCFVIIVGCWLPMVVSCCC